MSIITLEHSTIYTLARVVGQKYVCQSKQMSTRKICNFIVKEIIKTESKETKVAAYRYFSGHLILNSVRSGLNYLYHIYFVGIIN